jgi:hypothetical protein
MSAIMQPSWRISEIIDQNLTYQNREQYTIIYLAII